MNRLLLPGLVMVAYFFAFIAEAQETLVTPDDPYGMFEPDNVAGRGKTASAAADAVQSAASWINELGVRVLVTQLVKAENEGISDLLNESGQAGVLYRIDIQKVEGETPFYSVVNRSIQRVGAGSSPLAVNLAINQQDQLRPAPSPGASLDIDKSYFIWFTREGNQMVARDIPARNLVSATARAFADQKLLETQNEANRARALGASVAHLEKSIKDKALQKRFADWKAKQDATNQKVAEIHKRLNAELEKAKKAQRTAAIFSLISGSMTLASQAVTLKNSLGADAPAGAIDSAKTPADLQKIAKDVEVSATNNIEKMNVEYKGFVDQQNGIRGEYLLILRETKYPVGEVPELNWR